MGGHGDVLMEIGEGNEHFDVKFMDILQISRRNE
jgi:hypothetical protein